MLQVMRKTMRRILALLSVLLIAASIAWASATDPAFLTAVKNARFVYVTSYDGNEFNFNVLPEDRQAIANVQNAVQQWGHYIVVYRPEEADIILAVQSRGSEDVLALYDAHNPHSTYLWRAMGREGLQKGETPLVTELQQAVEKSTKK
jgi:hypothetical protein